jgi:steroid 5-alpha reductase family enzyme
MGNMSGGDFVTAAVVVALFMGGAWALQRRSHNAGIVDVCWAIAVGGLAVAAAALADGWIGRRIAIGGVMAIASARLAAYLLRDRVWARPEDGRYARLRTEWGAAATVRFFWFFQLQGLAAFLFALPAFIASRNPLPSLTLVEYAALVLWVVAFAGELIADAQLEGFKANPANRGRTCRIGLWRYSRHPNYFFEWLMWVAYALFASTSPYGLLALLCPLTMLYLLFRVTGIPATEAQALRSRGDDYRQYQQTTSAFFPWMPRP